MSQAAPGRKNRPWEDDDNQEAWKPSTQLPAQQPQAHEEPQTQAEASNRYQSAPHTPQLSQYFNDRSPQPSHHHRQRSPTAYHPQALTRSSGEQYPEWTYSRSTGRTIGYARESAPSSYPVRDAPKRWTEASGNFPPGPPSAPPLPPPPPPPPPPPSRPPSATYLNPSRDDNYQMPKRRKLSDEESTHSVAGEPESRLIHQRPPSCQTAPLPTLPSLYPQYPFSSSTMGGPSQSHQVIPSISSQGGSSTRPMHLSSEQSQPQPPPPPGGGPWRPQHPYSATTSLIHHQGYPPPIRHRLSPKLPSPPQRHPPPPPPPLPPPPPPPPAAISNSGDTTNIYHQSSNYLRYPSDRNSSTSHHQQTAPIVPDLENQYFRLSQENQYLRDELRRATSEFIPGDNLRGVVAQLFEVVEDYAETVAQQQQQVQEALNSIENIRTGASSGREDVGKGIPVPRRKAVSDKDLMTQETVVACLRGMHTTMKSKLNTLKRVGTMKTKVSLIERSVASGVGMQSTDRGQEIESSLQKVRHSERENARLQERIEILVRENESHLKRNQASEPNVSFRPPLNSSDPSVSGSRPSSPKLQASSQRRNTPPPASPSTATLAPSTAPSTAIYNETLTTLQHRLSVTQLELETLQGDHARLRAALQRSQQRASTLEKKHAVSNEENDALLSERDRYQMLYETLEEQLAEVTMSRDEFRRQAVAGGGQYTNILGMAARLEMKGVEDRKRWKEERDVLEKGKAELQRMVTEKEGELGRLKAEVKDLKDQVNRLRGEGGVRELHGSGGISADTEGEMLEWRSLSPSAISASNTQPEVKEPLAHLGTHPPADALEFINQNLRKRVLALEKTVREMRREGLDILRATERFMAVSEALD